MKIVRYSRAGLDMSLKTALGSDVYEAMEKARIMRPQLLELAVQKLFREMQAPEDMMLPHVHVLRQASLDLCHNGQFRFLEDSK